MVLLCWVSRLDLSNDVDELVGLQDSCSLATYLKIVSAVNHLFLPSFLPSNLTRVEKTSSEKPLPHHLS